MIALLLAAVTVHFAGHMVVARPAPGASPAPTIAFVPKDTMHEVVLLVRADDVNKFTKGDSGLQVRSAYLPNGAEALEIRLNRWDVLVGTKSDPTLTFQITSPWDVLKASLLAAKSADKMVAKPTAIQKTPTDVTARVLLQSDGTLETVRPSEYVVDKKWKCKVLSVECLYDGQQITDRLKWIAKGSVPVTFFSYDSLNAPELQLESDAELWFVSRIVEDVWPPSAESHIPSYGKALIFNNDLPGIENTQIDVKPVFCPPISAWR